MADQQQNDGSNPLTDIEIELLKMYQDSFKHMMTFSSGAILLASAVTGALFLNPKLETPLLLGVSIFLFVVGTFFAMLGFMLGPRYIYSVMDKDLVKDRRLRRLRSRSLLPILLWYSATAAFTGLSLFAMFALFNLSP